jgi:hypothetical protein
MFLLFDKRLPKIINYLGARVCATGPAQAAFTEASRGFTLFNGEHFIFGKDIGSRMPNDKNHIT